MNSSMFHSVTIYYKYWAKFCLQIHTALIEACPLYLFLKIKALLLLSQRTSVTQSIVRMWISFLKSFKWSRECLPGTGKGTSGIIASELRRWDNNCCVHPSDFQNHIPHAWTLHNPLSPCWDSGSCCGWPRGWADGQVHTAPGACCRIGGESLELGFGVLCFLLSFLRFLRWHRWECLLFSQNRLCTVLEPKTLVALDVCYLLLYGGRRLFHGLKFWKGSDQKMFSSVMQ